MRYRSNRKRLKKRNNRLSGKRWKKGAKRQKKRSKKLLSYGTSRGGIRL